MAVESRRDRSWDRLAACRIHDPTPWDAEGKGRCSSSTFAVSVCNRCPVQTDCLEYALTHHIWYGIWGGLLATQRRRLR